ncbi:MAG: hypothetical protein WKF89_14875 [Chitinophagaceae bacterium]
MNHICTWICADKVGEEGIFPQSNTRLKSSSKGHQNIYWRCLVVFYITSRRFNKNEKHVLFTNVRQLPEVDGVRMSDILKKLDVEVVCTDFKYKTPKGYFGTFQNQFYEFSILEYISQHNKCLDDQYLIVDSDCLFLKPASEMFNEAAKTGFMSFEDECTVDLVINGLSRRNMKTLYESLLSRTLNEIPGYHLGEFLLASVRNINKIFSDFQVLLPKMLERNSKGLPKFNEEAHTLSFLYFKNDLKASQNKTLMKRIWTNPLFYRNVSNADIHLVLWHLPAEKTFGIARLYEDFVHKSNHLGLEISDEAYLELLQKTLGIPSLPIKMKLKYYTISCYRAIKKRWPSFKMTGKPTLAG